MNCMSRLAFELHVLSWVVELFERSCRAHGLEVLSRLALRLHGLRRVVELVIVSYWAPGAEALLAIQPELI